MELINEAASESLCFASVISRINDKINIEEIISKIARLFKKYKINNKGIHMDQQSLKNAVTDCSVIILFIGSGGTEQIILNALKNYNGSVMLLSYNLNNSLAAAVEVLPALHSKRVNATLHHFRKEDIEKPFEECLTSAYGVFRFRTAKVGLIGKYSPWMVYSILDPRELEKLGIKIIKIPLKRLYEKFLNADEEEARKIARVYMRTTSSTVIPEGLVMAMKLHLAISEIIEEERLDAFTIECFEVIRVLGVSPCFSLAYHNSRGIVAGCEGDLNGLVTMMIASYISGEPAFMGNLADIMDDNTAIFAHCTAPLSIGTYTLTTHFETNKPLGVSVTPPPSRPVTVLKLDPSKRSLIIASGSIVSSVKRPGMCRTQFVIRFKNSIDWMLWESPGNHYVIVLGDHERKMIHAGEMLGFKPIIR